MPFKTENHCILVVDDDRLVLSMLTMGLEQAGFSILRATSGEEAVQICHQQLPDLIVMDIRMPGISGIEAAGKIQAIAEIPVIFLSAYDDTEIVEQAIGQGALGYKVKPVEVHQLVPEIRAALARFTDLQHSKNVGLQLERALNAQRDTSVAIGILMERRKLGAVAALEMLREESRPNRRKLAEVAKEIVSTTEGLNAPQ